MHPGPITPGPSDFDLSVRLLSDSLDHAGDAQGPPLELDLAAMPFLTADGLGRLVALRNRLDAMGGRLVLLNVGSVAYEAIRVAGLAGFLGAQPA